MKLSAAGPRSILRRWWGQLEELCPATTRCPAARQLESQREDRPPTPNVCIRSPGRSLPIPDRLSARWPTTFSILRHCWSSSKLINVTETTYSLNTYKIIPTRSFRRKKHIEIHARILTSPSSSRVQPFFSYLIRPSIAKFRLPCVERRTGRNIVRHRSRSFLPGRKGGRGRAAQVTRLGGQKSGRVGGRRLEIERNHGGWRSMVWGGDKFLR